MVYYDTKNKSGYKAIKQIICILIEIQSSAISCLSTREKNWIKKKKIWKNSKRWYQAVKYNKYNTNSKKTETLKIGEKKKVVN